MTNLRVYSGHKAGSWRNRLSFTSSRETRTKTSIILESDTCRHAAAMTHSIITQTTGVLASTFLSFQSIVEATIDFFPCLITVPMRNTRHDRRKYSSFLSFSDWLYRDIISLRPIMTSWNGLYLCTQLQLCFNYYTEKSTNYSYYESELSIWKLCIQSELWSNV